MSSFTITTVNTLPVELVGSTMYIVKATDVDLAEIYITNTDASEIKHIIDKTDITSLVDGIVYNAIGVDISVALKADQALSKYRVVKATATGCNYADCNNAGDYGKVVGIVLEDTAIDTNAKIVTTGIITDPSFTFNIGPVYLGNNGILTQTIPANQFIQQVGIAYEATKVLIKLSNAVVKVSNGSADGGKVPCLNPETGLLDQSFMPKGLVPDISNVIASENLAAGNLVNIYLNGDTANVRKATALVAGKEAHGYVITDVTSGDLATVYFENNNKSVTGLTPGKQYLSTTPGLCTNTPPSGSGNVVQMVGFALSATQLNFQYSTPLTLA